jgi:branched-chain amino acid transport system ATP-binding protein
VKKNPVVRAAYLGTEADNPVVANGSATTQVVPARRSCPQGAVASKAGKVDAASAERCPAERFLMVEHVDAGYGPSQVLFDLTLNLGKGEVVALLGRNGMGKSTLLKLIGGAIKPIRGRIFFGAQEVTAMPLHSVVRLGIGVVPEGRHIFPSLTVEENLVATAIKRGHESTWNLRRIYELFPRLEERRGNMGNMLSGGEQQMLAIGRALMTNPKLLILDEATEGLAPLICAEIWKVIARLKASGQSIMIVDKDITALARLADRFHLLEKGRFIWSGKPAELDDNIEFVRRHMSI